MVSLRVQKRLAANILKCGKAKVWMDPNATIHISMANSSMFLNFSYIYIYIHILSSFNSPMLSYILISNF